MLTLSHSPKLSTSRRAHRVASVTRSARRHTPKLDPLLFIFSYMARATRSGTKLDSDTLTDTQSNDVTALPPGKHKSIGGQGKKRKRNSNAENEDQPVAKQLRSATPIKDDDAVKDDVAQEKPLEVKGAGDVPILPEDAQRILDILEMCVTLSSFTIFTAVNMITYRVDTQGLLDRVFPLPADPAATLDPQSSSQPNTYSFRTLLQESQRHPLRVLKVCFSASCSLL